MKVVFSKCGNMCSSCPWGVWVRRNLTPEEWDSYAEDVKKYVGYNPTKNPCHGCQTPTEKLSKDVGVHNFLRGCSARKCAFHNEIRNCAYCSRYPCDKIKSLNLSNSREDAEERIGEPIPDDKYLAFVRIFEGMKNLDEIRSGLTSDQIQEVKMVDKKSPKVVAFPDAKKKHMKYKTLHDALSTIVTSDLGLIDTDTVAGQDMLMKRRAVLLRLLWITANYGSIEGVNLSVDSITINTHKKGTSGFPTTEGGWRRWLEILSKLGIHGDMKLAPLDKSELISPIGWLRDRIPGSNDPAWFLSVSLDKQHGGIGTLKKMQSYVKELEEEYDKRAFGRFTKADMRYLLDTG
ncbi:MAG: hypothetical protein ThorAB25_24750 [Candidatus Thorarchaeota archaeon AB_25]|nr:MAG: hypothetical protein ThorAB25_24750 [Candidatus Thorarchaeota archaeon AB_25]